MIKFIKHLFSRVKPYVPDGDIHNNDCAGPSYSNWWHEKICPVCLNFCTHNEIMTDICLGCGSKIPFSNSFRNVAVRKIIINGVVKTQIRDGRTNYIDKSKVEE